MGLRQSDDQGGGRGILASRDTFDINMPMLYKEGSQGVRSSGYEEHIMAGSVDHSILIWRPNLPVRAIPASHLLASRPADYAGAKGVARRLVGQSAQSFDIMTNPGLRITLPVMSNDEEILAVLNRAYEDDHIGPLCLRLTPGIDTTAPFTIQADDSPVLHNDPGKPQAHGEEGDHHRSETRPEGSLV